MDEGVADVGPLTSVWPKRWNFLNVELICAGYRRKMRAGSVVTGFRIGVESCVEEIKALEAADKVLDDEFM